ncbi:chondroitin sulfate glucuronyltransferase-like [Hyperolius riggenbachi]|uniref:chondroitin sulfate glucuronyltransferase-like n=1 Tax=Hyperolius riggenbachi TaxID=752182 RepID=UPI0035A2A390
MGPRLSCVLLGLLRPALPFILGLSLGCSLSLLRVSWLQGDDSPCLLRPQSHQGLHNGQADHQMNEFKPRIIPYNHRAHPPHKKVLRTRYIQSELGFRERLLVTVLSSRSTLNSLAVAVNRTLSPHVSRMLFSSGARGPKALPGMEVIIHGDERPAWLMYHTLRYLEVHFLSAYDWFYISQDDSYINSYRLQDVVNHLSPGPPVYIGQPMEFIGGQENWRYCSGASGYLLSRALLLSLGSHLDFCRSDILSSRPDEWLGRCLQDTLGIACVSKHQGMRYTSLNFPRNADVDNIEEKVLEETLSVHPIRDALLMYKLQRRLSQIRLHKTYSKIQRLQGEIRNLSTLTPEGEASLMWPLGVNPPFSPTSRFDLLTWEYFTESHTFSCPDGAPKCALQGVWLMDVQQVLDEALDQLNQRYHPWLHFRKRRLLNGYRRFDPTRGMEYTIDLLLEAYTKKGHAGVISKRLSLLRPLGIVEILPMPYVTEATRVQLVLPVMAADADHVAGFLDAFATNLLDPQENVALTVLLVYDMSTSAQEKDIFQEVRSIVSELERRYLFLRLELISVRTEAPSQIRLMEIVSKKHPMDTLFFLLSVWSEVTTEVLNRCRMNSISAWQVFSPIHYQEYNPEVSRHGFSAPPSSDFLREGHFDRLSSSEFCFYNSDFMAAQSRMAVEVGGQEEDGGIELLELFMRHSELHVFRALEPALVQRFSMKTCSSHLSEDGYHRCVLSSLESLGSRLHLAMALFHQDQTTST